jgi:hypothetical protein
MRALASALLIFAAADGGREDFDRSGTLPEGWASGVTGVGSPKWQIDVDATAPSGKQVLVQTGSGDFPWCINRLVTLRDGFVETRFKTLKGEEDQAGGLVWRFRDGDNYYLARANALEDNVTIFHVVSGRRRSFKSVDLKVAPKVWHTLRVEFVGPRFAVFLDGKRVLDAEDGTFKDGGAVGVWTKADSVTAFDAVGWGQVGAK